MTSKSATSSGDHPMAVNFAREPKGHNHPTKTASGRFDLWFKQMSCEHYAVIAQASALMRAHECVTKVHESPNRQAH